MYVNCSNRAFHLSHNHDTKITTITTEIGEDEIILTSKIMGLAECFGLLDLFDEQSDESLLKLGEKLC